MFNSAAAKSIKPSHAHTIYLDQLHINNERVTALRFEERFATIEQVAPEAVGDFRAEATVGRDELFALGRRLNESELERESCGRVSVLAEDDLPSIPKTLTIGCRRSWTSRSTAGVDRPPARGGKSRQKPRQSGLP